MPDTVLLPGNSDVVVHMKICNMGCHQNGFNTSGADGGPRKSWNSILMDE